MKQFFLPTYSFQRWETLEYPFHGSVFITGHNWKHGLCHDGFAWNCPADKIWWRTLGLASWPQRLLSIQSDSPCEKLQQKVFEKELIGSITIPAALNIIIRPNSMQANLFYCDYLWFKNGGREIMSVPLQILDSSLVNCIWGFVIYL